MTKNKITPELLENALNVLEQEKKINEKLKDKLNCVIHILNLMKDDKCWYSICEFNYAYIGNGFYHYLVRISDYDKEYLKNEDYFDKFFLYNIRFLREAMISLQRKYLENYSGLFESSDYSNIWNWFKSLSDDFVVTDLSDQFNYIQNELSFAILNDYVGRYLHGKEFQSFLSFEENIKLASDKTTELEIQVQKANDEVHKKIEEVQRLENSLKTYKEGFNFVGLASGFSKLLKKKENSKCIMFIFMFLISVCIIIMPFIKILSETKWAEVSWQQLLMGVGLEFVLIYFFRVVLNQYRVVETQIMQLELRLSLCQFIQSYVEYAKEIKTTDKDALDKFENLIFSSILSNDNNIPSTFDGMEQITQLIKELKSK